MSSHDEYSSDEEEITKSEKLTDVFLGFTDEPIPQRAEGENEGAITIEDSFIGGTPVWLHPESYPSASQLTCGNCGQLMALLLQAFAPWESDYYDRVIYVFACKNTSWCSRQKGSIRCLRGIRKDPQKMEKVRQQIEEEQNKASEDLKKQEAERKNRTEMMQNLFDKLAPVSTENNPFSSSSNPFQSPSNPFEKNAAIPKPGEDKGQKNIKSTPNQSSPTSTYAGAAASASANASQNPTSSEKDSKRRIKLPSYPGYFIYVDQESLKQNTSNFDLKKYKDLLQDMENDPVKNETLLNVSYSSSATANLPPQASKSALLNDRSFENFVSTVEHNPSQVLRYLLGGKPLLYTSKDSVAPRFVTKNAFNIPSPPYNPSSTRQFELQLMPKAIIDLEDIATSSASPQALLSGMSWGTIIVCTDKEDYIPPEFYDRNNCAYIEEWCGTQWEDLA